MVSQYFIYQYEKIQPNYDIPYVTRKITKVYKEKKIKWYNIDKEIRLRHMASLARTWTLQQSLPGLRRGSSCFILFGILSALCTDLRLRLKRPPEYREPLCQPRFLKMTSGRGPTLNHVPNKNATFDSEMSNKYTFLLLSHCHLRTYSI